MARSAYSLVWWFAFAAASAGLGALAAGAPWGPFMFVVGAVALANLAWNRQVGGRLLGPRWWVWALGLAGGTVATISTLVTGVPDEWRVAGALVGFQGLVAAAGVRPASAPGWGRSLLAGLGHSTVLLGTALLVQGAGTQEATMAIAGGYALLLLNAFWSQRALGGPGEEWEAVFLFALLLGLTLPFALAALPGLGFLALPLLAGSALLALGVLARPPFEAQGVALEPQGMPIALAHAATGVVVVNSVLYAYTLVSAPAFQAILFVFFFWIFLSVFLEYRSIRRAARRHRRRVDPPEADVPPGAVTLVVVAAEEPEVLRASVEANLALRTPFDVLLVVSGGARETVRVARRIERRHPERVRVVEADAGSKAADLNQAWPQVETPFLVLLDADETVDDAFLRRGYAHLQARAGVGLVQGRKVARDPDAGLIARFAHTERRFSTWLDHPMHAEDAAPHFGGSAAILRKRLLEDVGGFTEDALTEDVDLTIRIFLDARWDILYEPSMIALEANPRSALHLLRQRSRWARGWAQVTRAYLPEVLRARKKLGPVRSASLAWQLVTSVSAPWSVLLPLLVLVRATGVHPLFPLAVAIPLALVVLPARYIAFGFAAWTDPVAPIPRRSLLRWAELAVHAYGWILFGWLTQLHALYLELADAPRVWHLTEKGAPGPKARARRS